MRDPYSGARQLAKRMALLQVAATVVVTLLALALTQSMATAVAVCWGGLAMVAGQGVFALRQFSGLAPVSRLLQRFFAAAALKWLVLFAVFGAGLVLLRLSPGALLAGLMTAQLAGIWALLRYG